MTERTGSFFKSLQKEFVQLVDEHKLKEAKVKVTAKPLSPEDAIGSTKRKDYVILKGKERLLQAELMGCRGQAFTSALGDFTGTLEDVLALPLENDYQRAVYIATLNAAAYYTGKVKNTVHCRNEGPELCARQAADYFKEHYGQPHILMVGYQPALAEALNQAFQLTVLDLDPANIGRTINGVLIHDGGAANLDKHLAACDVIFATGSVMCNDTADPLTESGKPLVVFGTTGSGAAALLGIGRFCPESTEAVSKK